MHASRLALSAAALAAVVTIPSFASAAVVVESRYSGAVASGLVTSTSGAGVHTASPIPAVGQSPGESLSESIADTTPPTFAQYSSGSVSRQATINIITAGTTTRRPGATANTTMNMSDRRLLDTGGNTVGFSAGGSVSASAGTTISGSASSFPGSATASVSGLTTSMWTFTIDTPYRYYARGNAGVKSYGGPEGSGFAGASYSIESVGAAGEFLGAVDDAGVVHSDTAKAFADDGTLQPGRYRVRLDGEVVANAQRQGGLPPETGVSGQIGWASEFSLAAVDAPALTVGVAEESSYTGITATPSGPTAAALIGGTAGGARTVELAVLTGETAPSIIGNPVELTGTGGDKVVLQLTYDDSLITGSESALRLGWLDENGVWVNAIDGNSDGGIPGNFVLGAYNPAQHFVLSTWGVDTVNNTVWAVIDHNSTFGVNVVPEPASVALLAFGGLTLLRRRRR